jgi:hypothetical protein
MSLTVGASENLLESCFSEGYTVLPSISLVCAPPDLITNSSLPVVRASIEARIGRKENEIK